MPTFERRPWRAVHVGDVVRGRGGEWHEVVGFAGPMRVTTRPMVGARWPASYTIDPFAVMTCAVPADVGEALAILRERFPMMSIMDERETGKP